eukprot:NODE_3907_length_371_cov_566.686335_g3333_i0.p2 GENE.NODE_3907_length_371_cov_566.686335_g3333_i0~~NODE_3907_length_371_cov_566.686335_g3333_i0.p2  ORF type:complete len:101 (+),score=25.15 NODE_3907_length_371_cov_566.686335_g3333_i0:26-304(+)
MGSAVIEGKAAMLGKHQSQKEWLDESQGFDSYIEMMKSLAVEVGKMSGRYGYAEGWRRHMHAGLSQRDEDPLYEELKDRCFVCPKYEASLTE